MAAAAGECSTYEQNADESDMPHSTHPAAHGRDHSQADTISECTFEHRENATP